MASSFYHGRLKYYQLKKYIKRFKLHFLSSSFITKLFFLLISIFSVWIFFRHFAHFSFLSSPSSSSSPQSYAINSQNDKTICDKSRYPRSENLREDSVSILVNGFNEARIPLLKKNMQMYAQNPIVDSIYILWGNVSTSDELLSAIRSKKSNVPIYVVRQKTFSLNDRFLPRDFIRTRCVIICDDDIMVDDKTLHFSFQTWQENPRRIVGFFPRAHAYNSRTKAWMYTKLPDRYSIMLTKFMLIHVDFLYDYTCNIPTGVKEYVDKGMNCEDIAMNFVVSGRFGTGPLLVDGKPKDMGDTRNSETGFSRLGLSARSEHQKDRGSCISAFHKLFGSVQLRYSFGKAVPDVSEQVFCDKYGYSVHCDHKAKSEAQARRALGHHILHREEKFAYFTLIGSLGLVQPSVVFAQALRLTGTVHDIVLMVDETASLDLKDLTLTAHFDRIVKVNAIQNKYNVKGFNKLNAWKFDEYAKIVYVDVDTIVISNLDHLFSHPEISAVPDVYMSEKFNSGLLVLRPSKVTYDDMISKVDIIPSYNKGDQGFLNSYFNDWFQMPPPHRLHARYNTIVFFPPHYHPPSWFVVSSINEAIGPVAMVHFANPWFKPWRLKEKLKQKQEKKEWEREKEKDNEEENGLFGVQSLDDLKIQNLWCYIWIRLSDLLESNDWKPLPPDQVKSLTDWLPNKEDYHKPTGEVRLDGFGIEPAFNRVRNRTSIIPSLAYVGSDINNEAFVTVVWDENVFSAGVWANSFAQHHAFSNRRNIILLVSSTIPRRRWLAYRRLFNKIKVVNPLAIPRQNLTNEFMVLKIWRLVEYRKIVYVDSLALFTENCNELLANYKSFAAIPSVFPPDMFSSKVMVVKPSVEVYEDLVRNLPIVNFPEDSLDRFLNAYFYDWYESDHSHRISSSFGVDVWFKEGLMKFFYPWKILIFDRRGPPWSDLSTWRVFDRVRAAKLWRRIYCSLEDEFRVKEVDKICIDIFS